MTSFEWAIDSPATSSPSITVAASPEQLRVLRALTRTAATPLALSADRLADLILAVDEAASTLVNQALPTSTLTCAFAVDTEHSLRVILSATTSASINTSTTSLGWFVLQTLVDGVVLEQAPSVDQNWAVTIILNLALQAGS